MAVTLRSKSDKQEGREEQITCRSGRRAAWLLSILVLVCISFLSSSVRISTTTTSADVTSMVGASKTFAGQESPRERAPTKKECVWAPPPNDANDCETMLSSIVCSEESLLPSSRIGRRFLVFGDSTFGPSHLFKFLDPVLVGGAQIQISSSCSGDTMYKCEVRVGHGQCGNNDIFLLDPIRGDEWRQPETFEGPAEYNRRRFCTGCTGCKPTFLKCDVLNSSASTCRIGSTATPFGKKKKLVYGGYMPIEYARDVELQSPNYSTTQENILHYVQQEWNTPDLVKDFGKPTCIVGAGIHDAARMSFTRDIFVGNVRWYLDLLLETCSFVLWILNTAPLRTTPTRKITQTINQTRSWNDGVRRLISTEYNRSAVAFMDVFEASVGLPHLNSGDNIHMSVEWYYHLAVLLEDHMISIECEE